MSRGAEHSLRSWCDRAYPDDLTGKSVLDVGAGDGQLCFAAVERGAHRVVGLESNPELFMRARTAAQTLRAPVEFRLVNTEELSFDETFDYVLCRDVLQHASNPFLLLERLLDLTRERLVLDIAELGRRQQRELRLRWWRRLALLGLRGVPIVFVNRNTDRGHRRRYHVTADAVRCLLTEHRFLLSRVDVVRSPSGAGHMLIGHRKRIDRLIVIAGPPGAGKSTLIAAMADGKASDVAATLGIVGQSPWEPRGLHEVARDTRTELPTVVMHYDFLARLRRHDQRSEVRELLDTLRNARKTTFVTLWTEPGRLRQQFEENEIRRYVAKHGVEPRDGKTVRLCADYRDPKKIVDYYTSWFSFVSTLPGEHLVLAQFPSLRVMSVDEWRQEYGGDGSEEGSHVVD